MTRVISSYATADGKFWEAAFRCDFCQYLNIGTIPKSAAQITAAADSVFNENSDQMTPISWLPKKSRWKEYQDVPANIASAASEAYACFSINANRSAVLLARTTVEAIAKEHGITDGSLYHKIEQMQQDGIIPNTLRDEAHEIRLLGNDMAHGDLNVPVDEQDAADILGFLDSLLDYVYQLPMAVQKRRKIREAREHSKDANS